MSHDRPTKGACIINVYPDTLANAKWDVSADVDLASATADVYLAAAWRALTWTGAAVHTGATWRRTCQILVSGANPLTGVKVASTDGQPKVKVTVGGEVIESKSTLRFYLLP